MKCYIQKGSEEKYLIIINAYHDIIRLMTNQSFISNYNFTTSNNCFGCTKERIQLETANGKTFSIAVTHKIKLPRYINSLFWARVTLPDNSTLFINKKSLTKRTKVSKTFIKSTLRRSRDFDKMMRLLSKVDDIKKILEIEELYFPKHSPIEIVEKMEKNREKYLAKASNEGPFVKEWKNGRTLFVIPNPETGHTDFYLSLNNVLGSGGFKTVVALMDYEKGHAKLALSVQNGNPNKPSDINLIKKGTEFVAQLEDSKRVLKPKFYIEKGVKRDEEGELLNIEDKAKVYLATKRYDGTFNDLVKSHKISFNVKLELFCYILEGVDEIHEQNIVHRDIKFDNILYKKTSNGYKIKINDFDLSCYSNDERSLNHRTGTFNHMAPEVLGKEKLQHPTKTDCWSLGIMLYMLCENDPAFIHGLGKLSSNEKQVNQVLAGIKTLSFKNLDPDHPLIPVIRGLLDPNPASRMNVKEALQQVKNYLSNT